jgi:hypothetical protein
MKRVAILLVALAIVMVVAGCGSSAYDAQGDIAAVQKAMANRGLKVCATTDLSWTKTPGFVQGKMFDVGMSCDNYDANNPGARVYVAKFDSAESRTGAIRNFQVAGAHAGSGAGFIRGVGPWVVAIDGNGQLVSMTVMRQVLEDLGVN